MKFQRAFGVKPIVLSIYFFVITGIFALAQNIPLAPDTEISVLTIGPGEELFNAFGHSAFRVKNSSMDLVFNYGVYDFDTPNFYTKFARGKLHYKIDWNYFEDIQNHYVQKNRSIYEQVLNLSPEQKQQLYDFLILNLKPENQYYLYDFFYDNCATKIRDVLTESLDVPINFIAPEGFEPQTFRGLIRKNVPWNTWGAAGIDLALGSVIDRAATPSEHMFLPLYIHDFFGAAIFEDGTKLIKQEQVLFESSNPNPYTTDFWKNPFLVVLIFSALIAFVTFKDYKHTSRSRWLDGILFSTTGIVGSLLFLLWFATDHQATAYNYNMLWAFPINLLLVPLIVKKRPPLWTKKYLKFLLVLLVLMMVHWLTGVQQFSWAYLPLVLALAYRFYYLSTFFEDHSIDHGKK